MLSQLDSPGWGVYAVAFGLLYAVAHAAGAVRRLARRVDRLEERQGCHEFTIETLVHERTMDGWPPSDQYPCLVLFPGAGRKEA